MRGVTLVELLVVIALLGIAAGIAAVGLSPRAAEPAPAAHRAIAAARRLAIASGRPQTVRIPSNSERPLLATAHPDGSVIADSAVAVEYLTGRPHDASR